MLDKTKVSEKNRPPNNRFEIPNQYQPRKNFDEKF